MLLVVADDLLPLCRVNDLLTTQCHNDLLLLTLLLRHLDLLLVSLLSLTLLKIMIILLLCDDISLSLLISREDVLCRRWLLLDNLPGKSLNRIVLENNRHGL
jgi:hypothetical protein